MQRTWAFSTPEVSGNQVRVATTESLVTQKDVWLRIEVENVTPDPVQVTFESFVLTLPDGEEVVGYVSYLERRMSDLSNAWKKVRRKDTEDRGVAPGQAIEIQLNFHQYGRDFRRLPSLSIDLSGVLVDGHSATLEPLVIEAPPEAPLGEHI